jgi:hypothetical protein
MQSVCTLVPVEYARRVVDLRATVCEDPVLGAIYDPPFVHCTLQLAEEYDWPGITAALASFAPRWKPFEVPTIGLFAFTGAGTTIAVAPYKNQPFAAFHAAVWETITPYAQGRVDPFYHPDRWVPHITIKRCGPHPASFGTAMSKLATENFGWTMTMDNVAVQHDPGKNSLTHYLRLRFPLGEPTSSPPPTEESASAPMNATIRDVREIRASDGAPAWWATIQLDAGQEIELQWDAPTVVQLTAAARSAPMYFAGARCRVEEHAVVTTVSPKTPFPVAWSA